MALGFVFFQNNLNPFPECRVLKPQPFGNIFMNSGFTYFELLGGGADRGIVFNYVFSKYGGSVFYRIPHTINSNFSGV